jgi:hypothetical protein
MLRQKAEEVALKLNLELFEWQVKQITIACFLDSFGVCVLKLSDDR